MVFVKMRNEQNINRLVIFKGILDDCLTINLRLGAAIVDNAKAIAVSATKLFRIKRTLTNRMKGSCHFHSQTHLYNTIGSDPMTKVFTATIPPHPCLIAKSSNAIMVIPPTTPCHQNSLFPTAANTHQLINSPPTSAYKLRPYVATMFSRIRRLGDIEEVKS